MTRFLPTALAFLFIAAGAAAQTAQEQLSRRARELQKEVTALRGLAFTREVAIGEYTREELAEFLRKELDRDLPREKALRIQKAYAHFGLVAEGFELRQAVLSLLGSTIAAFYHPRTRELRLIRGPGAPDYRTTEQSLEEQFGVRPDLEGATLVHELCHAAQDQHFDLTNLPPDLDTNDDLVLAVRALVEGDASIVGLKYGLKDKFEALVRLFGEEYKKATNLGDPQVMPAILRRTHTFPYGYGMDFVLEILGRAKDDPQAVSKAFADPPLSTEQIMHPAKYQAPARDWPRDIDFADLANVAGARWKEIARNVHGEFGILVLLDEFKQGTAKERREAGEGWDGDRYVVFEAAGGRMASVWYSVWDSEQDAAEFFAAYAGVLQAKHEGAKKEATDQKAVFQKADGTRAILERRGADVLALDGADEDLATRLNALWSCARAFEVTSLPRVPARKD